jgi:hypothetical protein
MSNLPDFDALWNYDRPAESERAFRDLLPLATGNPAYEPELLTQIARAQGLQRQFEAGHENAERGRAAADARHAEGAGALTAGTRAVVQFGRR